MSDARTKEIIDEWEDIMEDRNPTHIGERFVRFMSLDEFYSLKIGETLTNNKRHSTHAPSSSVGFCFLPAEGDGRKDIKRYAEFLVGVVSDEVAVVFKNRHAELTDNWGVYADPEGWGDQSMVVDEVCTERYSKRSMVPIYAYGDPFGKILKLDV